MHMQVLGEMVLPLEELYTQNTSELTKPFPAQAGLALSLTMVWTCTKRPTEPKDSKGFLGNLFAGGGGGSSAAAAAATAAATAPAATAAEAAPALAPAQTTHQATHQARTHNQNQNHNQNHNRKP